MIRTLRRRRNSYVRKATLGEFWPEGARPKPPPEPDIVIKLDPAESWGQKWRRVLWERDPCCCWCGFLFVDPDFATIEHLLPRAYGGTTSMRNCRVACERCNHNRGQWYEKRRLERKPRLQMQT